MHRLRTMSDSEFTFPFEKLRVWQDARRWICTIYSMTSRFPKGEAFNLTSQMQRASVSVATNLAEGTARTSPKDQAHFTQIAYSSLMETACLTILAADQAYITEADLAGHRKEIAGLSNQLNALHRSQIARISGR